MPNPVSRRSIAIAAAVVIAAIGPVTPSSAQSFPDRSIRFFVPFPAGGSTGAVALGVNIGERTKRMYDPAKDLAPISRAAESPFILVATPSLNAGTLADVVKLAKAEPNR